MWNWHRGDKITAERLQHMLELARARPRGGRRIAASMAAGGRVTIGLRGEQIIPRRKAGGGGTKLIEVRIVRALADLLDASDQREVDTFDAVGPHLKCWQIAGDGSYVTEIFDGQTVNKYVVVWPNWPHPVSDFKKPNGEQIYDPQHPAPPIFGAFAGGRGLTLSFGEGERWVPAPEAAALCADQGPPAPTSACCFGQAECADLTFDECLAMSGVWQSGLSCLASACGQLNGACCYPGGGCLSQTFVNCNLTEGVFQGTGTSCTPNPCPGQAQGPEGQDAGSKGQRGRGSETPGLLARLRRQLGGP